MVLPVHGGPWGRDVYGYNGTHQWLANRGYAVLSTNFRASTGFGKKFVAAGNLMWGTKMHDDLLDATDWAVKSGITTDDKVAIMGGSYGGYATLAGLAFTPEKFACGVDIVGPSNLNTLLKTIPPYWEAGKAQMYARMGNPTTPEGQALLKERSPLYKADQIKRPLLIGQGANDPRVNVAESEQIVNAMKEKGIPSPTSCSRMKGMGSRGRRTASPSTRLPRISSPNASADVPSRSARRSRLRPRRCSTEPSSPPASRTRSLPGEAPAAAADCAAVAAWL
jgi:dipeptidyl aminopeptidase/acylaminoacyl peptidase